MAGEEDYPDFPIVLDYRIDVLGASLKFCLVATGEAPTTMLAHMKSFHSPKYQVSAPSDAPASAPGFFKVMMQQKSATGFQPQSSIGYQSIFSTPHNLASGPGSVFNRDSSNQRPPPIVALSRALRKSLGSKSTFPKRLPRVLTKVGNLRNQPLSSPSPLPL